MTLATRFRRIHGSRRLSALCLAGICLLWMSPSPAEIYRWVDNDGKVHFGDKPLHPDTAAAVTPVEIQQAYQPPERTAEEAETFRQEQARIFNYQTERAVAERAEKAERAALEREQIDEICARYAADVRKFSALAADADGRLVRYYIEEEGKSVSEQRQRELVAQMRAEMAHLGCR